jgi:hypothetical protein
MTYHRNTGNCKRPKVPICQIEDRIKERQAKYLLDTGSYLSIPRAIVKLVLGE